MLVVGAASPASAAVNGYTTANVNERSGPSTSYPPIVVIPAGSGVTIYGCLSDKSWCDVAWGLNRGWVYSSYLQVAYHARRVPIWSYSLGVPFITFNFDSYWGSHYRNRPFFGQRSQWSKFPWWGNHGPDNNYPKPFPPKPSGKPGDHKPPFPPKPPGNPNDHKPPFGAKPPFGNGQMGDHKGPPPGKDCKWINGQWVCKWPNQ
jgi:uncharacterized protein YraI